MTKIHEILMKHAFEPDKTLQALQAFMKADPVNFERMANIVDDNRLSPLGLIFYYSAACTASYDEVVVFLRMCGAKISPDSIEAKMVQHIKNNGARDMSTLGKMINDKLTEGLTLAQRSSHINVCDVLPAEGGVRKAVELAEFEQQHKITWCRSIMMCKAYVDYTRGITESFFFSTIAAISTIAITQAKQ